jgi:hypothetical protein
MTNFDAKTLSALRDANEIAIRTKKHPDTAVPIWVTVAGDEVFVRSVRGPKGRWYRDVVADGSATVEFAGRRLAVRAIPARDPAAVDRVSREYLRKYGSSAHAQSIVKPDVLPTTLHLEPLGG